MILASNRWLTIDATRQFRRVQNQKIATGIDKVDLAYINHFKSSALALLRLKNRWYLLNYKYSQLLFSAILLNQPLCKAQILYFCASSVLPKNGKSRVLINTSHSGLEQPSYAVKAKQYFKHVIYFLHDIIPLEYPEYCKEGEYDKHVQRVKTIIDSASLVITNSNDTKEKLDSYCEHMPRFKYIEKSVALLGIETNISVDTVSQILLPPANPPYFVTLGTIEPRKNHLLLLQVWRKLAEDMKEQCPKLYIIGKRGWDIEQVTDILERAPYAKTTIIECTNACDQQVAQLLKNSTALLFPSFAEGFGLPLVQALQLSTPVIASDLKVFKELVGNIPDYIDPIDTLKWLDVIKNYILPESTLYRAQKTRLKQFKATDWAQHFDQISPKVNTFVSE